MFLAFIPKTGANAPVYRTVTYTGQVVANASIPAPPAWAKGAVFDYIYIVGGGGGAGGGAVAPNATNYSTYGGGGGSGKAASAFLRGVPANDTYYINVGAGGLGGNVATNGTGGGTTFVRQASNGGTILSAAGGGFGRAGNTVLNGIALRGIGYVNGTNGTLTVRGTGGNGMSTNYGLNKAPVVNVGIGGRGGDRADFGGTATKGTNAVQGYADYSITYVEKAYTGYWGPVVANQSVPAATNYTLPSAPPGAISGEATVYMIGGGGAGAGTNADVNSYGGGGGSSGQPIIFTASLNVSNTYRLSLGPGGAKLTYLLPGSNGYASLFVDVTGATTLATALGGLGGNSGAKSTNRGLGGIAYANGVNGASGAIDNSNTGGAGAGGNGSATNYIFPAGLWPTNANYGSGGNGAYYFGGKYISARAGSPGWALVKITWNFA